MNGPGYQEYILIPTSTALFRQLESGLPDHPILKVQQLSPQIDNLAGLIPAGEIVPLRTWNENVFLDPSPFIRFQEMTGGLGKWAPVTDITPRNLTAPPYPQPCRNPGHDTVGDPQTIKLWVSNSRDHAPVHAISGRPAPTGASQAGA